MILQSTPGLLVMAFFAECLPILPIPEQILIATMRNDVINHRRRGQSLFLLALDTQRMLPQAGSPRLALLPIVALGSSLTAQTFAA